MSRVILEQEWIISQLSTLAYSYNSYHPRISVEVVVVLKCSQLTISEWLLGVIDLVRCLRIVT